MKRLLVIAALSLATAAPAALAQPWGDRPSMGAGRGDHDQARDAVRKGRQLELAQVIRMIAARTPGRQLNTTPGEYGGHPAFFVQWETPDGRVLIFIVDAESGAILARQGG
ncbi:MAG: hypothetical protein ABW042_11900 [Phenylobacterium sp.]